MSARVVLAYSGGLDTSVAIPYLAKMTGGDVVAVSLDLGQGGEDMESVRQRALDCGAVESIVIDLSLIHISEPTRLYPKSRIPSSA